MQENPPEFVIIDEHGIPRNSQQSLRPEFAAELLRNLKFSTNGAFFSEVAGQTMLIEAFDQPLVAMAVHPENNSGDDSMWNLELPFQVLKKFRLSELYSDEWDRFLGLTTDSLPFVLSSSAQDQFFDALDEFDDSSFRYHGKTYTMKSWLAPSPSVEQAKFWSEIYNQGEARWDLGAPSPILFDLLPRLKIPKSRVLVLGCGGGHDAALFAQQGHVVTAVDISREAVQLAKNQYSALGPINFVVADVFRLPVEWAGQFDVIFEHTLFCAINPSLRQELVKNWLRLLAPQGHLLAAFFATYLGNSGPPFGASEWELRQRLKKSFQFVFWGRWRQSVERRQGLELAVYAQKKSL